MKDPPTIIYTSQPSYGFEQNFKQKGFSNQELQELAIAMLVLVFAFTIIWSGGWGNFTPQAVMISVVVVSTGFLSHELGHKFLAQKYGCWAEFRMSKQGLLMALLFSMFGLLFAAPGAVLHQGYLTQKQSKDLKNYTVFIIKTSEPIYYDEAYIVIVPANESQVMIGDSFKGLTKDLSKGNFTFNATPGSTKLNAGDTLNFIGSFPNQYEGTEIRIVYIPTNQLVASRVLD